LAPLEPTEMVPPATLKYAADHTYRERERRKG
jgi:hypothetical protein